VLKWQTPLEGIKNDMFWVKRQEEVAVYLGKLVKRSAPGAHDYITLDPKESVSTHIDISEVYDISKSGNYTIEFDSRVLDVGTEEPHTLSARLDDTAEPKIERLRSKVVDFDLLEDREAKQSKGVALELVDRMDPAAAEVSSFSSCTTNQRNQLVDALGAAQGMARDIQTALKTTQEQSRPNSKRYLEWFGVHTSQNYDKIIRDFDMIEDALSNKRITFNCSMADCSSGEFAHVFPTRPYEIFLCSSFWNADLTGTDSRGGTLIHEISHFNVVAGTDDIVYGQPKCRQLAMTNPLDAILNADSHEYIAENNPLLNM
jgi:peptidyl-Lys metalloendopeptidase